MQRTIPGRITTVVLSALVLAAGSVLAADDSTKQDKPLLTLPDSLFSAKPAAAPALPPSTVVAVVEGKNLTQGEVDEIVNRVMSMNAARIPPERMAEARANISMRAKEDLITQMVLLNTADKAGVKVDRAEIEKAEKSIPLPEGKTLDQVLADQKITKTRLEQDIERALKIKALFEKNVPAVQVTDAQVKEFYEKKPELFQMGEQATARHILISVPDGATEQVKDAKKKLAEDVRKQLTDGGDFAALAKKYSEDPGSKDNGGIYTFPRGKMVKAFEDAAFTQKINEIGPLVETQFGFHIIQTTNRTAAKTVSLEEASPRIKEVLKNQDRAEAGQKYVAELRSKAKITYPAGQ